MREPTSYSLDAFHRSLIAGRSEEAAICAAIAAELAEYRENCAYWQARLAAIEETRQPALVIPDPPTDRYGVHATRQLLRAGSVEA